MPKDFLGQELYVGDEVVHIRKKYHELIKSKIVVLNPCKAKLENSYQDFYRNIVKVPKEI